MHQSLTIRTEPPGAAVYVNDVLKGKSPLTYDFQWYGWYRLTLRKDGYERLDDRKLLRAPAYLWIPFDVMMELLPVPVSDARVWSYTLIPAEELPAPVPPAITPPTPKPARTHEKDIPLIANPSAATQDAPMADSPAPTAQESQPAKAPPEPASMPPPSTEPSDVTR